jgi:hypothetical protein
VLCRQFYSLVITWTVLCGSILPSLAREPEPLVVPNNHTAVVEDKFTTFPCGLNLGDRQLLPSMMVRGKEDGSKAIDFNNWSIPFNVLTRTLNIKTKTLPDGKIELRSSAAVSKISPQQLNSYPEIGLAIKIKDLQTYLGIKSEFDLIDYTIKLTLPEAIGLGIGGGSVESTIVFDGLEAKTPESLKLTAIEQKYSLNTSNGSSGSEKSLRAAGTIFGSSWYAQFGGNSDRILDLSLKDAQIVKYSEKSDYIIGGQSAFWNRQNSGNYWGITGIWRQGFTPQLSDSGGVSTSERTQANKVGRSIVGNARPGTLVRLLPVGRDRAIAEVLVDGTGVFRFDHVAVTEGDRYYRLWLFANGQLSAAPEVRDVNFVTVPGQLPSGATATLASLGLRREEGGLGKFSDVRGSVVTHWGVSEELTLGSGVSLDRGVQGLGELYFQPNGVPLEAAISVRTGAEWDLLSNINWNPSNNLKFGWNIDKLSHRVKGDWKVSPQFAVTSNYDSRDALGIGFDYATRSADKSTSLQASFDTNSRLRWRAGQQVGQWELQHQNNEVGTISHLTYSLDRQSSGNAIELSYQTSQVNTSNQFATLAWRYRPTTQANWEAELGYGVGNVGGGWLASGAVNVLPGVNLRGRYQTGINSDTPSFSLELVSNLETQSGWRENPQQLEALRTQGGIEIIPFLDRNGNGQQDPGEKSHLDLELINLNHRPLKPYRPLIKDNRISLRVAPGKYRIDFDPSGFPINWRTQATGYAVEVAAGSYTKVLVPFVPSYTIEGIVLDRSGKPQAGAKVELIPTTGGDSTFSITSRDGQFYLEALSPGSYQVQINGKPIPGSLFGLPSLRDATRWRSLRFALTAIVTLNSSSEPSQVLNLKSMD